MEDMDDKLLDPKEILEWRINDMTNVILILQDELRIMLEQKAELEKPHKIGFIYSHKQDGKA